MRVLTFIEARARLKGVLKAVVEDRAPIVVTRRGDEAVVLVSLADWAAMDETSHLLSTSANSARLTQAIRELDAGAA